MVSLAPFVLKRPWLTKMLTPAANWYANAAGYRQLGLRYEMPKPFELFLRIWRKTGMLSTNLKERISNETQELGNMAGNQDIEKSWRHNLEVGAHEKYQRVR
jgi:hypothetical protein